MSTQAGTYGRVQAHRAAGRPVFRTWEQAVLLVAAVVVLCGVVLSAQYVLVGPAHARAYLEDVLTAVNLVLLARLGRQLR